MDNKRIPANFYSLDYMETYAHVVKPILFQLLFAYSAFND